jgi:hypothetical protein
LNGLDSGLDNRFVSELRTESCGLQSERNSARAGGGDSQRAAPEAKLTGRELHGKAEVGSSADRSRQGRQTGYLKSIAG